MKPAVIFAVPMATAHAYCWRWRSVVGKTHSTTQFDYYYDCLADANANGHSVEVVVAQGNTAPGWRSLPAQAAL